MQKHLFEYAVIRVVPRVEREEFINIGVIVYCAKLKFLQVKYLLNDGRLLSLYADLDIECLHENLHSFTCICQGGKNGGPIAQLDLASRFRWLTATRSTVLQCSKVHPGMTADPQETTNRLFEQLVL